MSLSNTMCNLLPSPSKLIKVLSKTLLNQHQTSQREHSIINYPPLLICYKQPSRLRFLIRIQYCVHTLTFRDSQTNQGFSENKLCELLNQHRNELMFDFNASAFFLTFAIQYVVVFCSYTRGSQAHKGFSKNMVCKLLNKLELRL